VIVAMNEYRSNPRGSLSHHGGHHPIDAGKSMDKLFGGLGLFLEGLKWALVIALVLLVVGAVTGYRGRRVL
jgi:hypothetical protein